MERCTCKNICPILTLNLRSPSRRDKLYWSEQTLSLALAVRRLHTIFFRFGFISMDFVSLKMMLFSLYFSFRKQRFSPHLQWNLLLLGRSRRREKNIVAQVSLDFSPSLNKRKTKRNPCRTQHWYFECVLLASNGIRFNKFINMAHCFMYVKYNLRLLDTGHWAMCTGRLLLFSSFDLSLSGPRRALFFLVHCMQLLKITRKKCMKKWLCEHTVRERERDIYM